MIAKLNESRPRRQRTEEPKEIHSRQELNRIADAAHAGLRAAVARIRKNRGIPYRFRPGGLPPVRGRRLELLD
ncbi:hypothetical protein [Streptomyces enissocaesilis]|uniref:Transposase n=1 Tax=Streptomyces enissocaesilis TaxID=332589 RepID=A0ABN3X8N0_9ACTN